MEKFTNFFTDFLWFKMDRFDLLATVTTPIRHLSSLWIECGFSFFSKGWDIDEIEIGGRHRGYDSKFLE
jgi:hypothetical protein